jgi:hypothetical protein
MVIAAERDAHFLRNAKAGMRGVFSAAEKAGF